MQEITACLGFDYYAYGATRVNGATRPDVAIYSNYPEAWLSLYRRQHYHRIDPVLQQCLASPLPVLWGCDAPAPEQRCFWEDAQRHGLRHGWSHACRNVSGSVGILSLVRSGLEIDRQQLHEHEPRLVWLLQVLHSRMAGSVMAAVATDEAQALSPREIEVLQWSAEGKSAGDLATILGISERTVNFHVHQAMQKLNAPNKICAVYRAAVKDVLGFGLQNVC
jgi:LuxR family transcriptional regulator